MPTRTRIKFDSKGFRAILLSGGMRQLVRGEADTIASRVPGASARTISGGYGGGRVIGFVVTKPDNASEAVAQREALESAVLAGGG